MLEVSNRNTRTRCETCSKLTIKALERRQQRCSGVFIVNFEHISHLVLVILLLTLNVLLQAGYEVLLTEKHVQGSLVVKFKWIISKFFHGLNLACQLYAMTNNLSKVNEKESFSTVAGLRSADLTSQALKRHHCEEINKAFMFYPE